MTEDPAALAASLPALQRLALAYAPARARGATLGLLALDAKLAGIVRKAGEPMLGQLRLAWWRDRLQSEAASWPAGEPVLAMLSTWSGGHHALAGLADGWEALLAEPPLGEDAVRALADARGNAFGALAAQLGHGARRDTAFRLAHDWSIADLAAGLHEPDGRHVAGLMQGRIAWSSPPLPRALRPLAVLHGLARRSARRGETLDRLGPGALLPAMRIGLLGR